MTSFEGTEPPPKRWCHATTTLQHFVIVSYRVDLDALRDHLPVGVEPRRFLFDDGSVGGLVSSVLFIDRDFRFRFMPLVRASFGQVNYRAYVSVRDQDGVWFFGTSLDSPWVAVPRFLWQMPWHYDHLWINATWGDQPRVWATMAGRWGAGHLDAIGTGSRLDRLDGFADGTETLRVLTHPMIGWYRRRDGRVASYNIWHQVCDLAVLHANAARFAVFESLGLVAPGAPVHSVLGQASIEFHVHTPPRLLT